MKATEKSTAGCPELAAGQRLPIDVGLLGLTL
jgi:hypothetical protein